MSTSQRQSSQGSSGDHSVRRPQRKKRQASLNHLLNFSLPDRPDDFDSYNEDHIHHDDPFSTNLTTYKPYRKEHYVNANFRFLLDPTGDYSLHLDDPDACFDWNLIEQVLVYSTQVPTCPICLDTPIAARIAQCGHIFCFSCILHSFHENGRICPICLDPTTVRELRPIQTLQCKKYKVGDGIDLCLMRREPYSMHPFPVNDNKKTTNTNGMIPHDTTELLPYARFMLASSNTLQITRERDTADLMASIEACQQEENSDAELAHLLTGLELLSNGNDHHKGKPQLQRQYSNRNHNNHDHNHCQGNERKCYYFYQARDGQWIFPGTHTIRILLQAFGDYADFPPEIMNATLTHVEEQLLTEERRKRYKFLGHVPLGCNISWIEIDLKGIVPDELLIIASPSSSQEQLNSVEEKERKEDDDDEEEEEDGNYQYLDRNYDNEKEENTQDLLSLSMKEEWSDEEEMLEYVLKLSTVHQ